MTDSIDIPRGTPGRSLEEVIEVGGDERYGIKEWTDEQVEYRRALRESNLGVARTIVGPGDEGRIFELARLSVPQSSARLWGVQWDVQTEPEPGPFLGREVGFVARSRLQLRWGCGGVQHFAEVDFARGNRVALFGSYVSVSIRVEGVDIGTSIARVRASIAETDTRANNQLFFTEYIGDVAQGASSPIHPVPPFASLFHANMTNTTFTEHFSTRNYVFFDRFGTVVTIYNDEFNNIIDGFFMPLMGDCVKFLWDNNDPVENQDGCAIIFALQL